MLHRQTTAIQSRLVEILVDRKRQTQSLRPRLQQLGISNDNPRYRSRRLAKRDHQVGANAGRFSRRYCQSVCHTRYSLISTKASSRSSFSHSCSSSSKRRWCRI